MIKHPPNNLNNTESMKDMVNWFNIHNKNKIKKITKAVINGNRISKNTIKSYSKCAELISQNRILSELNNEYKLLNQLLQND